MMHVTAKDLHCRVRGNPEIFKDFDTEKNLNKSPRTVAEEKYLKTGEMIYIDIISQRKSFYVGSKNLILIQD